MPYSQIRINKTKELQAMLQFLKGQLKLLSESDIIKLALSEFYARCQQGRFDDAPVEFGPLLEEEVMPEMQKNAEKALKQFKDDPSSFVDIR
jgi:hypothetical protein